jgi:ubiquinone/menaquinone biosynthesis C-methylase UbiE
MTYQLMARLYDQFMTDAPYDKWVELTENIMERYQLGKPNIVDLGCGTGEITLKLKQRGYSIIGVDASTDMLTIAEQKASEINQTIQWIHQDLRELHGLSNIDLAISYCDVINYITSKSDVEIVFQHVSEVLNDNGLFVFDVHSMTHVETNLIGNTFADVTDENAYIWFCYEGEAKGEMYHDLTFFSRNGDQYMRFDETHHEQTFPVSVYEEMLKKCGLEILAICGDFLLENAFSEEETERIFIIAQKRTR